MAITPLTKRRVLYADISKDLDLHPVSNDMSRKTNEEAIKASIRNLVLTNRGERLFQPFIGCDVTGSLFENVDPSVLEDVRSAITDTIETFEPRCNLIGVDVFGNYDSNEIRVAIVFSVINSPEPITLELILNRVR